MTATSSGATRLVQLSAAEFRARLTEALTIYTRAMGYPQSTIQQRAPMWLGHILRDEWRNVAALDTDGRLVGFAYGYRGLPGQWWHEQVRAGVEEAVRQGNPPAGPGPWSEGERPGDAATAWLEDYFELTELHVRPESQALGTGEDLLRALLDGVERAAVLLSTPEGTTRAWRLYQRVGFAPLLRQHRFAGDPRPFAILGRALPL